MKKGAYEIKALETAALPMASWRVSLISLACCDHLIFSEPRLLIKESAASILFSITLDRSQNKQKSTYYGCTRPRLVSSVFLAWQYRTLFSFGLALAAGRKVHPWQFAIVSLLLAVFPPHLAEQAIWEQDSIFIVSPNIVWNNPIPLWLFCKCVELSPIPTKQPR